METDTEITDEFPVLAGRLADLKDTYTIVATKKGITIATRQMNFHLSRNDLEALEECRKPRTKELKYYGSAGIGIGSYYEFFLELGHSEYLYIKDGEWPGKAPLQFKLEKTHVSIGTASPLMALLMEPVFLDNNYYPNGLGSLCTIQLRGVAKEQEKPAVAKALYYLNSQYLRPLELFARIRSIAITFNDPLGLEGGGKKDFEKEFETIIRSRTRNRLDYKTIEPLLLFNHAAQANEMEQFLNYYRVLEFFMQRGVIKAIDTARYDRTVTSQQILKTIATRNEKSQLEQLIQKILTDAKKRKLDEYARRNVPMKCTSQGSLADQLYTFRNSVIHAKEAEITQTTLPSPFQPDELLARWNYIVKILADNAIRKLNT